MAVHNIVIDGKHFTVEQIMHENVNSLLLAWQLGCLAFYWQSSCFQNRDIKELFVCFMISNDCSKAATSRSLFSAVPCHTVPCYTSLHCMSYHQTHKSIWRTGTNLLTVHAVEFFPLCVAFFFSEQNVFPRAEISGKDSSRMSACAWIFPHVESSVKNTVE